MDIYVVLKSNRVNVYNDWYRVTSYQLYSKVFFFMKSVYIIAFLIYRFVNSIADYIAIIRDAYFNFDNI